MPTFKTEDTYSITISKKLNHFDESRMVSLNHSTVCTVNISLGIATYIQMSLIVLAYLFTENSFMSKA